MKTVCLTQFTLVDLWLLNESIRALLQTLVVVQEEIIIDATLGAFVGSLVTVQTGAITLITVGKLWLSRINLVVTTDGALCHALILLQFG